tara:strand:+ start:1049 stop:1783 length:735 start_codon:yes stop_codon:yes gene_type:complete
MTQHLSTVNRQAQEILNRTFDASRNRLKVTGLLDFENFDGLFKWFDPAAGWTAAVTGSGSTSQQVGMMELKTGLTNPSTARLLGHFAQGFSRGQGPSVLDFSKRIVIILKFDLTYITSGDNGSFIATVGIGNLPAAVGGDPSDHFLGIRLVDRALSGLDHDGTALGTTSLSTTVTESALYDVVIVSDGEGNVEWFVNGVSTRSTSTGPKTVAAASDDYPIAEIDNNAAHNDRLRIYYFAAYVEQ